MFWSVEEVVGKKRKEGNKEKKEGYVCGGSGREKEERRKNRK